MGGIGEGFIQWSQRKEGWTDTIIIPNIQQGPGITFTYLHFFLQFWRNRRYCHPTVPVNTINSL